MEEWNISMSDEDRNKITDVTFGTTANYAYKLYLDKIRQIDDLKYECDLLIDKYHAEMCNAHIPPWFREDILDDLFSKDKDICSLARKHFLELCFSDEFLKKFEVEFVNSMKHGYGRTAFTVILGIGDYDYYVEIPLPKNINTKDDKTRLVGQVKFQVVRLLKSKREEFFKMMESVQFLTYDWKKCFDAIEADVKSMSEKAN